MEQRKWSSVNNVGIYPGIPGPRRPGGKKSKAETLVTDDGTVNGNEVVETNENGDQNGNAEEENIETQVRILLI